MVRTRASVGTTPTHPIVTHLSELEALLPWVNQENFRVLGIDTGMSRLGFIGKINLSQY